MGVRKRTIPRLSSSRSVKELWRHRYAIPSRTGRAIIGTVAGGRVGCEREPRSVAAAAESQVAGQSHADPGPDGRLRSRALPSRRRGVTAVQFKVTSAAIRQLRLSDSDPSLLGRTAPC